MHQAAISGNRLALAQQRMIDAAIQSPNVRHQFSTLAQIDALTAQNLPAWFFQEPHHPQKKKALYLASVWDEAKELKDYYSARLVAEASTRYPNLYSYILEGQKPNVSFVAAMGMRFKQNIPSQNLMVLMNDLNERYPHHLLWAEDPERFEIYIAGIRGQQMYEGMDLDKTLRYCTTFQNLFTKGCYALDAMNRLEGKGVYAIASNTASQPALVEPIDVQKVNQEIDVKAKQILVSSKIADEVVDCIDSPGSIRNDDLQNEMPL